jgi:hypothetical protein
VTSLDHARKTTLRERAQEITAEYWSVRDEQSERVAVAQLILALAHAEAAINTLSEKEPA